MIISWKDRKHGRLCVGVTEPDSKPCSCSLFSLQQVRTGASSHMCGIKGTCWLCHGTGQQADARIRADDVGGDSRVKRRGKAPQTHVIYLVGPLFVLFRERIEDFPNCRAPEVFYQVYSPPYVTH